MAMCRNRGRFSKACETSTGHFAVWHANTLTVEPYWQGDWSRVKNRTVAEDTEELPRGPARRGGEQMISDVPLGRFFQADDSTIIAGLMQQTTNHSVKTFAIGFPDPEYNESHYAKLAAEHLGTVHESFMVEPRAWETLRGVAGSLTSRSRIVGAANLVCLSRDSPASVTVALTGDAGDELFGGYDRYRALGLTELFQRCRSGRGSCWAARWCGSCLEPASQRAFSASSSGWWSTSTIPRPIATWGG